MILTLRKNYGQFITSGAQLLLLHVGFRQDSRTGWLVCLALIALLSLFAWASTLGRRRAIVDTPTSRIASAAQGYVELSGAGRPPEPPLLSHLTHLPCLWYRWRVETGNGKSSRTVDSGESELPFLIDDGSGQCLVDPEGAEILTRHKKSWYQGDYRCIEWKLLINDRIYALGEFRTLGGGSVDLNARHDLNEILTEWKKDRKTLLRRFDLDGDGGISEKEWGLARLAARREVAKRHREARDASDVHTLSRPRCGRHFLLSNLDPNSLARRYLWWSLFHLAAFLGALGAIPWVLHHFR
ncbi:MAG: E3 ubiquitin ligase family protein [Candidatus Accumulibacter sp.]|jgi:hypothetical protein|nr:E3 ubiquitin ligase family protein [Accumulibacter sp.]